MVARVHLLRAVVCERLVLTAYLWLSCSALGCGDERREGGEASSQQDAALGSSSEQADAGVTPESDGSEPADLDADLVVVANDAALQQGDAAQGPEIGEDAGVRGGVDAATGLRSPSVLRGDPRASYWDLRVRGVDLQRYEGKQVVVRLGRFEEPNERLATGSAHVERGSFELFFPQAWESGLYKIKRAFIDVDGNGRCDAGQDPVFVDSRAAKIDVLELHDHTSTITRMEFARASDPAAECAALNESWPSPESEPL